MYNTFFEPERNETVISKNEKLKKEKHIWTNLSAVVHEAESRVSKEISKGEAT